MKIINTMLLGLLLVCNHCAQATFSGFGKLFNLCKSATTFHVTMYYGGVRYGSTFNFQRIAADRCTVDAAAHNGVSVQIKNGNIDAINDGKKTPLVLGSIPRKKKHIQKLKETFNLHDKAEIVIYSLNRKFERNWAGLSNLVDKDAHITLFKYPTTDFTAPLLIDVLRAVRDLKDRDNQNQELALVQCKAGRGRSAAIMAAYLIVLLHEAEVEIDPNQVEQYLISHRSQVKLNKQAKALLHDFQQKLKKAGSFESLCKLYEDEIKERDKNVMAM